LAKNYISLLLLEIYNAITLARQRWQTTCWPITQHTPSAAGGNAPGGRPAAGYELEWLSPRRGLAPDAPGVQAAADNGTEGAATGIKPSVMTDSMQLSVVSFQL
jgi:hypothetical protein